MFTTGLEPLLAKIASLTMGLEGPKAWQATMSKKLSPTGRAARDYLDTLTGQSGPPKPPARMPAGSQAGPLPGR